MANDMVRFNDSRNLPTQVEQDLLAVLQASLQTEDAIYPWNLNDPDTEAYLERLDQQFALDDWQPEDISTRSHQFFSHVDSLWIVAPVQTALFERFASRVPQELLSNIARHAQRVFATPAALADQLVQCAREVLPSTWAEDDLYLFARPLAYAMRGQEVETALSHTVPQKTWAELSDVEQARLTMAIARYALTQVEQQQDGE